MEPLRDKGEDCKWTLHRRTNENCKLDIRKYAFSQRTVNEWNKLPAVCMNVTSVLYEQVRRELE